MLCFSAAPTPTLRESITLKGRADRVARGGRRGPLPGSLTTDHASPEMCIHRRRSRFLGRTLLRREAQNRRAVDLT
jgi:hypothetical protein